MKSSDKIRHSGRPVVKMVWIVTLLGFGVGLFMLVIVYWTLSLIHSEREILSAFQVDMARMVTSLDTYLDQGKEDINELLSRNRETPVPSEGLWISDLLSLIDHYRGMSENADMQHSLDELQVLTQKFLEARAACLQYNFEMRRLLDIIPEAGMAVDQTLNDMRNAITRIEGRQRLQRAMAIRDYRSGPPSQMFKEGRKIIDDLVRGNDIAAVKTEIADLALLCERLMNENQIDNLADLKDNSFMAALGRLRRGINQLSIRKVDDKDPPGNLPISLVNRFETDLFGEDFKASKVRQTIILGRNGLFTLHRKDLLLQLRSERLQTTINHLFDSSRKTRQRLVLEADDLASRTAHSAELKLKESWQTMLLVWLLSTSAFLVLCTRIARTAQRQITVIENANADLQNEIEERQRIENALRQNRSELRKAKDELEIRVDERTRELKQTNEQLGREMGVRKRTEEQLRQRGHELSAALSTARKARRIAETERDRSQKALAEVTESKRRQEILISDATSREEHMVALKNEINILRQQLGMPPKYRAPMQVKQFLEQNRNN